MPIMPSAGPGLLVQQSPHICWKSLTVAISRLHTSPPELLQPEFWHLQPEFWLRKPLWDSSASLSASAWLLAVSVP